MFYVTLYLSMLMVSPHMSEEGQIHCNIDGSENLNTELPSDQLCASFIEKLESGLIGSNGAIALGAISISVNPRGYLSAQITAEKNGEKLQLPEVRVDVMDRSLRKGDLDFLASATSAMLVRQSEY